MSAFASVPAVFIFQASGTFLETMFFLEAAAFEPAAFDAVSALAGLFDANAENPSLAGGRVPFHTAEIRL